MPLRDLFECATDAQSSSQTFAKRRSLHSHRVRNSSRLDRDCGGAPCDHILAQAGSLIALWACRRPANTPSSSSRVLRHARATGPPHAAWLL